MKKLYLRIILLIGFVIFIFLLYLSNTMVEPILSLETRAKFTTGDVTTIVRSIKEISNTKDIILFISLFGAIAFIILFIISYTFPLLKSKIIKYQK